jgi:hypothetical protein
VEGDGVWLRAFLASDDGKTMVRAESVGSEVVGTELATDLRERLRLEGS